MDGNDLRDYAQPIWKKYYQGYGCGQVECSGTVCHAHLVEYDRLINYNLTIDERCRCLRSYNVEVSAGQFGGMPAVKGQRLMPPLLSRVS